MNENVTLVNPQTSFNYCVDHRAAFGRRNIYDFLLIRRCKYLVLFLSYLTLDNIMTLKIWLEVTHVIQTGTVQKLECGFLFAFHSNYSSILHQFRDKARYWSKIVIPFIPALHSTPRYIAIPVV